jgi:hypothetical protein
MFAHFLLKALRRDPILAVRLGLAAARGRASYRRSRVSARRFLDLDPESPLLAGCTINFVEDVLERTLEQAIALQHMRNSDKRGA